MNPILKRFIKGLGATVLAFAIKFVLDNAGLFVSPSLLPIITGLLLAIEKAFPNNL